MAAATPSCTRRLISMRRGSIGLNRVGCKFAARNPATKKTLARRQGSISFALVDHVQQRFAGAIAAKILAEQRVVALPQFLRETCRMRRNQQVIDGPQRRLREQGFAVEYIQSSTRNAACAKRLHQSGLVDLRTASDIDEVRRCLHL